MSYYSDAECKIIKTELLDEEAEKLAKSFVDRPPKLSSAQMRRFFGEFRQLEKKVFSSISFEEVKPLIKMVKSKASYAANRPNNRIPDTFKKFLTDNVNAINTKDDFKAFMLHFEAVVGFYYGQPGVRNN